MAYMNKDFEHFWQWFQHNYPGTHATKESILEQYDKHYFCTCEGCEYNKEHGIMPTRVHPSCKLPIQAFSPNPWPNAAP